MEKQRTLSNELTILYFDESRKIAADRWLVKIRCLATIPLQQWMTDALLGNDEQTSFCRDRFNGLLTYETILERNFIDETEVSIVTDQLCDNFDETTLRYFAKEEFVRNLFAARVADYADLFLRQQMTKSLPESDDDDVSGSADFSHCFK